MRQIGLAIAGKRPSRTQRRPFLGDTSAPRRLRKRWKLLWQPYPRACLEHGAHELSTKLDAGKGIGASDVLLCEYEARVKIDDGPTIVTRGPSGIQTERHTNPVFERDAHFLPASPALEMVRLDRLTTIPKRSTWTVPHSSHEAYSRTIMLQPINGAACEVTSLIELPSSE